MTTLSELLLRWEEAVQAGQPITPEALCGDCPELLNELRQRIGALQRMEPLVRFADDLQPGPRRSSVETIGDFGGAGMSKWPVVPGYEIVDELGQGGMGVVYKARQTALGRMVALKMILGGQHLQKERLTRFLVEARALATIRHPNIVQIYEIGELDGRPYLALEYMDGGTLDDHFQGKLMTSAAAAELVATVARAVQAAHDQGVIHRDLKPGNILFQHLSEGRSIPKVADFGLAKQMADQSGHTQTGAILGTPSYMAPEQAMGQHSVGPASDIYALGATLYELLTGRPPFLAESPLETLQQVRNQEPVPPRRLQPRVPRDLETIVLKCLRKNPGRRYASAGDLADDLRRFLRSEPIVARPTGRVERLWRWCQRKPSQAALIAFASIALIGFIGAVLWFNRELERELYEKQVAHEKTLAAEVKLRDALVQQVAERLNSELRQLAAVPETMAASLALRTDWKEEQLLAWVEELLRQRPRIFGMCVAFEPFQMGPRHEDYALYMYRRPMGLHTKQLVPPSYMPIYREWEWYKVPHEKGEGRWSEPYVGVGADRTPMVTYSAPIMRRKSCVGVVTADLSIEFFRVLRDSLQELKLGEGSYLCVLSQKGVLLYHPDQAFEFPADGSKLPTNQNDPEYRELMQRILRDPSGRGEAVDFTTGRRSTFMFVEIPFTDWALVLVTPKEGD